MPQVEQGVSWTEANQGGEQRQNAIPKPNRSAAPRPGNQPGTGDEATNTITGSIVFFHSVWVECSNAHTLHEEGLAFGDEVTEQSCAKTLSAPPSHETPPARPTRERPFPFLPAQETRLAKNARGRQQTRSAEFDAVESDLATFPADELSPHGFRDGESHDTGCFARGENLFASGKFHSHRSGGKLAAFGSGGLLRHGGKEFRCGK